MLKVDVKKRFLDTIFIKLCIGRKIDLVAVGKHCIALWNLSSMFVYYPFLWSFIQTFGVWIWLTV